MAAKQKEPAEEYVAEAGRLLGFAAGDLVTARSNHAHTAVPNRNAAYMAQRAAEKALRAVILLENRPFDMIHDIDVLAGVVPSDFVVPVPTADLSWLADVESSARYPDEGETITTADAEQAIEIADRIVSASSRHFLARGVPVGAFAVL